jgi:DNA polymerase elongation subunit (family B)
MSYVDVYHDKEKDVLHIVERVNGKRVYKESPANYVFYYDDPKGKFRSIYGTPVSRFSTRNSKEFHKELKIQSNKTTYESDINAIFRHLETNYLDQDAPNLHVAFLDIEVDFDKDNGFSSPADALTKITAITVYLKWLDQLITLAIAPESWKHRADEITSAFENTFLFDDEAMMINTFLDLIEDADILTGWNSEGYDIPYLVNRTSRVLSKDDTRRFCLWGLYPKKREYEKFGNTLITYDPVGRVHIDYLELYRKYTYEERHSYRLDAIGEYEVNETKTVYEGTLDQLYNNDFKKFIEYNRQDVALLVKIDNKLKFLDLANELAHANTVLLPTTMGAVAVTEQAIINEAHLRGMVVPNRTRRLTDESTQAAGAYVAYPKKGLHDWIGAVDINSLYPSAIRAMNMGPETIIGQIRQSMTQQMIETRMGSKKSFAEAWEGEFSAREYQAIINKDAGVELIVDWENKGSEILSAAQIYKIIFDSNKPWSISANGTIFNQEVEGIIPGLLTRWYKERKEMQDKLKESTTKEDQDFWDRRQLVKKINLNSLYGAILNPGCRFFDQRIGQSTTLTGRSIARHMAGKINEILAGEYDHLGKSIIYGDTDSCYFSAYPLYKEAIDNDEIEWDKERVIELYDAVADAVNESFPDFMYEAFHVPHSKGSLIKAGRELVAIKGLFITKKRYAVLIYDKEGKREDVNGKPGKIKAMGLDLKRSDTPVFIQEFLEQVLIKVLTGEDQNDVINYINEFKAKISTKPSYEKGTPKRVNNLTKFLKEEERLGKANMPGHVRASLNWNKLRDMNSDKYSLKIMDGQKIIVCKLKDNPLGYTSVAYPIDELHLPKWFLDLPFDVAEMEKTIIDAKLDNLIGVLEWDMSKTDNSSNFNEFFSF